MMAPCDYKQARKSTTPDQETETMHTDHIAVCPGNSPCDPSPRRSLRWGVTRMVRAAAIPLLLLAGIAPTPTEVSAGSITYSLVDYPASQNGYTLEGSITTNGSTGTIISTDFIKDWSITILLNGVTQVTYSGGSGVAG